MQIEAQTLGSLPAPAGNYSHVVRVNGLIFTAGFGPQVPETGLVPDSVADQTRQVLRNIEAALAAYGSDLRNVVKVTAHLQNLERDFRDFDEVFGEFFKAPYPVRTTVGSVLANILVEIDVVAAAPPQ